MEEKKIKTEEIKTEEIKAQANTCLNYNKSGQPGRDANPAIAPDHKNWGLLRCVSPTNNY